LGENVNFVVLYIRRRKLCLFIWWNDSLPTNYYVQIHWI